MYKSHSIWDEEQEKYENLPVHKDGDKAEYKNQRDYNAGEDQSDVYDSKRGDDEKKKKEDAKGIEKEVEKETKKYEKKEDATEDDIKKKAADEIRQGSSTSDKPKSKKEHKSIEDAINKAMKEEKEVIYMKE